MQIREIVSRLCCSVPSIDFCLALLLPLLTLTLMQEAPSHMETCECHQIRAIVNTTVQEAIYSRPRGHAGNNYEVTVSG